MCTNVAAGVCSLEAIGRPAVVIAGGKDKGSDYTALGAAFAKYAKHVVLIGKDAHLLEYAWAYHGMAMTVLVTATFFSLPDTYPSVSV